MDHTTFDTLTRSLGSVTTQEAVISRRSALRGLVAGTLALAGGASALETQARRGKKKGKGKGKGKKKNRQLQPGDFCQTDKQCRTTPDFICGRPRIFSEERVCCGALDALCDETGQSGQRCCYGYLCASGRCIVV